MKGVGLTALSDEALQHLIAQIELGRARCPLDEAELERANISPDRAALLLGHSEEATRALLLATLAERRHRPAHRPELVWTGQDVPGAAPRDTSVVVRELFAAAQTSVLIAGFSFDHGDDIFAPLHAAMREHGVSTEIFLEIKRRPKKDRHPDTYAARAVARFLSSNWPFGDPTPTIYYDPRTLEPDSVCSLHAKCIVVDEKTTLVTSANFTNRGHTRNIEVGALLYDESFAKNLVRQWRAAVSANLLRRG